MLRAAGAAARATGACREAREGVPRPSIRTGLTYILSAGGTVKAGATGATGATALRPAAGAKMVAERFSCSCKRFLSSANCVSSSEVRRRASRNCSGISKRSAGMASRLVGEARCVDAFVVRARPGEVFSSRSSVERERCEDKRASSSRSGRAVRASSSLASAPFCRSRFCRSNRSAARFSIRCPGRPVAGVVVPEAFWGTGSS